VRAECAPDPERPNVWRVGELVRVLACQHGEVGLGVGVDGCELTEPQTRGLISALTAAHSRTWPEAYE
jgi:hypothetical protein